MFTGGALLGDTWILTRICSPYAGGSDSLQPTCRHKPSVLQMWVMRAIPQWRVRGGKKLQHQFSKPVLAC
jgi:hypothetical protein